MQTVITRLARWGGRAALATTLLWAGAAPVAVAQDLKGAANAPASPTTDEVLWDQTEIGETGGGFTASSRYDPFLSEIDNQAADDFENNDGVPWQITQVQVFGTYDGGSGGSTVQSLLVQIYSDADGRPGSLLTSQTIASGSITNLASGNFLVTLSPTVVVGPGRYWLSVQANKPDFFNTGRQWVWYEKETQVLNPSMWRQPGNGYFKNPPCFNFEARVDYCDQPTNTENYDLVFAVYGHSALSNSVPNPVPVLTQLVPPNHAPVGLTGPSMTLVLAGANFLSNSTVVWNGNPLSPSATSGTRLTVTVPGSYIATAGTAQVKVNNPGPGGGDSNEKTFIIRAILYLPQAHRP